MRPLVRSATLRPIRCRLSLSDCGRLFPSGRRSIPHRLAASEWARNGGRRKRRDWIQLNERRRAQPERTGALLAIPRILSRFQKSSFNRSEVLRCDGCHDPKQRSGGLSIQKTGSDDELANHSVLRILHCRRNTAIKWRDSQALRYSISFPHKRLGPVCDSALHMLT
jgi:hypothetical protein